MGDAPGPRINGLLPLTRRCALGRTEDIAMKSKKTLDIKLVRDHSGRPQISHKVRDQCSTADDAHVFFQIQPRDKSQQPVPVAQHA